MPALSLFISVFFASGFLMADELTHSLVIQRYGQVDPEYLAPSSERLSNQRFSLITPEAGNPTSIEPISEHITGNVSLDNLIRRDRATDQRMKDNARARQFKR